MLKKIIVSFGILLLLSGCTGNTEDSGERGDLVTFETSSGDITLFVEVADTVSERTEGLMNRTFLPDNQGMLFVFDKETKQTFWMKNTLISLDIIFIDEDFRIVGIAKKTKTNQTEEVYPSPKPAKYIIEVNGGWADKNNVKTGDYVSIDFL